MFLYDEKQIFPFSKLCKRNKKQHPVGGSSFFCSCNILKEMILSKDFEQLQSIAYVILIA